EGIVTGSVVKVGAPIQINTRIYRTGESVPVSLSITAENLDRLLPTLKPHAKAILSELNKAPAVNVSAPAPAAEVPTSPKAQAPSAPSAPSSTLEKTEKKEAGKREAESYAASN